MGEFVKGDILGQSFVSLKEPLIFQPLHLFMYITSDVPRHVHKSILLIARSSIYSLLQLILCTIHRHLYLYKLFDMLSMDLARYIYSVKDSFAYILL